MAGDDQARRRGLRDCVNGSRESALSGRAGRAYAEPEMPRTFEALKAWFVECWSEALPIRLHERGDEDHDVLGSPRWAAAFRRRILNASKRGWLVTGWDKHGDPRAVDHEGYTLSPFLFYLERDLNSRTKSEQIGAEALVRWAYLGWDIVRTGEANVPIIEKDYMEALLEKALRRLWWRCQREPERYSVCPDCHRRQCCCGEKSEAQVRAEEAGGRTLETALA